MIFFFFFLVIVLAAAWLWIIGLCNFALSPLLSFFLLCSEYSFLEGEQLLQRKSGSLTRTLPQQSYFIRDTGKPGLKLTKFFNLKFIQRAYFLKIMVLFFLYISSVRKMRPNKRNVMFQVAQLTLQKILPNLIYFLKRKCWKYDQLSCLKNGGGGRGGGLLRLLLRSFSFKPWESSWSLTLLQTRKNNIFCWAKLVKHFVTTNY